MHAPIRTEADRDRMVAFLKIHYRPLSVILSPIGCFEDDLRGPLTEDMSYGSSFSRWYIGFDYVAAIGLDRAWLKAFLRWVALKVGPRHAFEGMVVASPYIVYDSATSLDDLDQVWPVLLSEVPGHPQYESFVGDTLGFRESSQHLRKVEESASSADKLIRAEIQRLDVLWENL